MSFECVYTWATKFRKLGCIFWFYAGIKLQQKSFVGVSRAYLDLYKQCIKALDKGEELSAGVSIDDLSKSTYTDLTKV